MQQRRPHFLPASWESKGDKHHVISLSLNEFLETTAVPGCCAGGALEIVKQLSRNKKPKFA
jgi:hypothetical protein